ncbi:hydrogen gas-evolving membrane-bound hydrogenase subunit E [Persicirhabdus sediminis]|uniref:DUF4040 domain-containing protein n=1 Tax=Persicirhabdus sediminis TaxID=454144 RepID=A0A8J7MBT5_9BACT|nr:hydrogen gas-evolving membrane-bound hydrogenase subunit E [Persicirhabdus sediminis]MBK1789601.1 DUF4040 domain-containing protein [Persicirhabdus sediminis]
MMSIATWVWIPFILALVTLVATPLMKRMPQAFSLALAAVMLVPGILCVQQLVAGESQQYSLAWFEALGINFDLRSHPFSLFFGALIFLIGASVVAYTGFYLTPKKFVNRFMVALLVFAGSMVGLVFSNNILLMFLFWELTSVSSYFMIGHYHEQLDSRKKALQALLVTGTGGLVLLAGFALLGSMGGSYLLSELVEKRELLVNHELYTAMVICIFIGAFTKSAQFPFHFWLPNAMAGPAPASAFLHSATMVKAGLFLLAVMSPIIGGTALWNQTLMVIGGITLIISCLSGLVQTDVKKLLAYSTTAALGFLTMLLGIGTEEAFVAFVLFLAAHAFYKAPLFMIAGSIEHHAHSRDIRTISGLCKAMPGTSIAAGMALLSVAGIPPMAGFIGKEYAYKATSFYPSSDINLLTIVAVFGAAVMIALSALAVVGPLWRKSEKPEHRHETTVQWGAPLFLTMIGLAVGLAPIWFASTFQSMAASLWNDDVNMAIKLWAGVNLPLVLSIITVATGVIIYLYIGRFRPAGEKIYAGFAKWGPERAYDASLAGMLAFAKWQTNAIQHGRLRGYIAATFASATALIAYKLWFSWSWQDYQVSFDNPAAELAVAIIGVIMLLAALFALKARSRLKAIVGMSIVGLGIALLFAVFSAPDLAITQILVETLVAILLAFVLPLLPEMRRYASKAVKRTDLAISLSAGLVMAIIVLKSTSVNLHVPISDFMGEQSYLMAHGKNVVNVILVDFRAMDTFGEVTVLAIASIGVLALLRTTAKEAGCGHKTSIILRVVGKFLLPILMVLALIVFYRGHNEPGGGFIGALLGCCGFGLILLNSSDSGLVAKTQRLSKLLLGVGLFLSALAGVVGSLAGTDFFTGLWIAPNLPLIGELHLGTPLLFDVGVFLTVIGFTCTVLASFSNQPLEKEY